MTPEDIATMLAIARRLFGEVFALNSGDPLQVIVANARNPRQAIEYRIPEPDCGARTISVTEGVEVRFYPTTQPNEPLPRVGIVHPEGLPVLTVVPLSDRERAAVRACLTERLTGKVLCRQLHWPYNGTSRTVFARCIEKGCLDRTSEGYRATETGRLSVGIETQADDRQSEP